jgi:hypothetical protein
VGHVFREGEEQDWQDFIEGVGQGKLKPKDKRKLEVLT